MIKQTAGSLTLENITIDGNNVVANYGLISIGSSTININGGATLQNGKSAINGGAIRIEDNTNGVLNLNGGTISNNSAPGAGAIQVGFEGEANINSGTISNNIGTEGSGAIYSAGLLNLKGGNITNNSATDIGGSIVVGDNSSMNIYGGNVNNNTSSSILYNNIGFIHGMVNDYQGNVSITDANIFNIATVLNNTLVVDISGGIVANGTNIQIYQNNNSNAQKWQFIKLS